jgi:two-component system chemotaxis response regulator CheY
MKLLIVDDSKAMRMIVRRWIVQAGISFSTVFEAENGLEAIKVIEEQSPDLVLTDWNMPEMKGIEMLKRIRYRGHKVPLGFITSEGTQEIHELAIEAGAQFIIVKPFTPAAIELALKPYLF